MKPKMTITEKILARKVRKKSVTAGEIVDVDVDWCMTNDATTHLTIGLFENEIKNKKIFDPKNVIFIIDHNVPSESVKTTQSQNMMRKFSSLHKIPLYDGIGICHQLMLEKHVLPGQIIVAADSHTCSYGALGAFGTGLGCTDIVATMVTGKTWLQVPGTIRFNLFGRLGKGVDARDLILKIIGDIGCDGATYMAMEFGGPGLQGLTVNDRIVLCNMAVEAGAKNGIVETDEQTKSYLTQTRGYCDDFEYLKSDQGCSYEAVYDYDLSLIEPAVVGPDFVDNYKTVYETTGKKINQGFIGSCNHGRIEQLRIAASILKDRKIDNGVKLLVSPASQNVYLQAIEEGLIDTFIKSGCMVLNPNCSVCWGGCQGLIGAKEVLISTGTRNFKGRAGSLDSQIYLASAATVAASCLNGEVVDPRQMMPRTFL